MPSLLLTSVSFNPPICNPTHWNRSTFHPQHYLPIFVWKQTIYSQQSGSQCCFDMTGHRILGSILHTSYAITGWAFKFIQSYVFGCTQCVGIGQPLSSLTCSNMDVSPGSVLGPIIFTSIPHQSASILQHFTTAICWRYSTILLSHWQHPSIQSPTSSFASPHSTLGSSTYGDKSEAITFGTSHCRHHCPNIRPWNHPSQPPHS